MRIALITDIHANLPALRTALESVRRHSPDRILSLGDQINLGPCPRETLELLARHDVTCLHGNHEGYILSVMAGDETFSGVNFESLRFNAARVTAEEITFPRELRIEGITFCHAIPGNDRFPVNDPKKALPLLRAMQAKEPTHIVCGHAHNPVQYRLPNLMIDSIGSVGCMDNGAPGMTNYAILDLERGASVLQPYTVPYDTRPLRGLFMRSGMADQCPVMARLICLQMESNFDYLLRFLHLAFPISRSRGEEHMSRESWLLADERFDWPDGKTTAEYWKEAGR